MLLLCCIVLQAQPNGNQQPTADHLKLCQDSHAPVATDAAAAIMAAPPQIKLTVPAGTPIRIAISKRVRIAHAGAPVNGRVIETVYAFDQPVIPAGSEVRGHLARVAPVSKLRRTMAFADADFTPSHQYTVTFDKIILGAGRELRVVTMPTQATQKLIHVASDPARAAKRRNAATKAMDSAKQQAKDTYHRAMTEIKSPGKMHRAKQYLLAQLPYRRQYLEPGTRFDADLQKPLDFGSATRVPEQLGSIGMKPAQDTTLHARLTAEVSSATATRGMPVEAVLTKPVFNAAHQLLLPANSRVIGKVTRAKPAGRLHHNGELRVVFEKIEIPENRVQTMRGSLEGVEVESSANMKIDNEGGARTTDSKSRYLYAGLSLVAVAAALDPDNNWGALDVISEPAERHAAGGSGFKLVGAIINVASDSRVFSSALGFYGAGMSVYSHFLSRGKDVVFPKDTPVEIAFERGHTAHLSR
ncbi:hypothetical protein AYO50_02165 [Acidobacteria bacterium SCGC AG-212-P17]|nr:hypothetical protein AYO50_02165 [Acidobacteria bacterium SCGC AG-212-P17]